MNGDFVAVDDTGVSTDNIPIEDTTMISAGTSLQDPNFVGPVQPGGQGAGWIDPTLDSTGDEGYVDSSGALGGGNSTSSNDPNAADPAPGSPVGSWAGIISGLESATVGGAQIANAIEGKPNPSSILGKKAQSAPVKGSLPSWLSKLFGPTTNPSTTTAGSSNMALVGTLVVAILVIGLGWVVYKGVKG